MGASSGITYCHIQQFKRCWFLCHGKGNHCLQLTEVARQTWVTHNCNAVHISWILSYTICNVQLTVGCLWRPLCGRSHFVNYRQTVIVVSIEIYLSAGIERPGVSGRSSTRVCLPVATPLKLKSSGSNVAAVAVAVLSCLFPTPTHHPPPTPVSLCLLFWVGVGQCSVQGGTA